MPKGRCSRPPSPLITSVRAQPPTIFPHIEVHTDHPVEPLDLPSEDPNPVLPSTAAFPPQVSLNPSTPSVDLGIKASQQEDSWSTCQMAEIIF